MPSAPREQRDLSATTKTFSIASDLDFFASTPLHPSASFPIILYQLVIDLSGMSLLLSWVVITFS